MDDAAADGRIPMRVGPLHVAAATVLAWAGFFVHNIADLPGQTLASPESFLPTIVWLVAAALWLFPRTRRAGAWSLLVWSTVNLRRQRTHRPAAALPSVRAGADRAALCVPRRLRTVTAATHRGHLDLAASLGRAPARLAEPWRGDGDHGAGVAPGVPYRRSSRAATSRSSNAVTYRGKTMSQKAPGVLLRAGWSPTALESRLAGSTRAAR